MSVMIMSAKGFQNIASALKMRSYNINNLLLLDIEKFFGFTYRNDTFDKIDEKINAKVLELQKANIQAHNERYKDSENVSQIEFIEPLRLESEIIQMSDVQLYKCLECLLYNISDGELYNELHKFTCKFARHIVSETAEYKTADWSF